MRELLARWMAGLTAFLVTVLAIVFAFIQNPPPQSAILNQRDLPVWDSRTSPAIIRNSIDLELGMVLYSTLRCRNCHSIGGEGNRRNPLDGAGDRLEAEEIRQWILEPDEIDPAILKPDYNFLSEDQINLLINYILSLK